MNILKKVIPITLATAMLISLSGCKNEEDVKKVKEKIIHEKNPVATMQVEYEAADGTKKEGTIKMELFANEAPETVDNFVNLAQNGFYDGLTFHRIIKDFMIQGGDPNGNGAGSAKVSDIDKSVEKGSDKDYNYSIKGEFPLNKVENNLKFEAGTLAMARADYSQFGLAEEGYNSGCSQFFITNTDDASVAKALQDSYTVFGKVIEGYDVVLGLSDVKVTNNGGEVSKPEKAPVIKSVTVETFGEKYDLPELINADEIQEKVQKKYQELTRQYYGY